MPQQSLVITGEPVFRALADPTRRAIFDRLVRQSMSVKVIAADMLVSQPAVSQHLKVLKEANLVAEQRKGRVHLYSVNPLALQWLSWSSGSSRDDALASPEASLPPVSAPGSNCDSIAMAMGQWAQVWRDHDPLSVGIIVRRRLRARHLEALSERAAERFGLNS